MDSHLTDAEIEAAWRVLRDAWDQNPRPDPPSRKAAFTDKWCSNAE